MHSGSDYGSTMKVISVVLANKAFSDILEGDTSEKFSFAPLAWSMS